MWISDRPSYLFRPRRSIPFLIGLARPVSRDFRRCNHLSYRRTAAKNKPDPKGQAM